MKLADGTNTISDERFNHAADQLRDLQFDDQMAAAAGRTEELPHEMSARHTREWIRLDEDRMHLGVQEWIKLYPGQSNTTIVSQYHYLDDPREEFEADQRARDTQFQKAISGPVKEIKNLSDDVLIHIWERREHVDPAIVRAAAHELARAFPGFHETPALWHKLASEKSYEAAAETIAAAKPQEERFRIATEGRMADTPREQMREYYQRRAIAAGMTQPLRQGELFRQTEAQTQQQTRRETNVVEMVPTNRNIQRLTP